MPAVNDLIVSDGQQQIVVSGTQRELQERFAASHRQHVDHMRASLQRFGLPLIAIDTVDDPLQQLLRALGSQP